LPCGGFRLSDDVSSFKSFIYTFSSILIPIFLHFFFSDIFLKFKEIYVSTIYLNLGALKCFHFISPFLEKGIFYIFILHLFVYTDLLNSVFSFFIDFLFPSVFVSSRTFLCVIVVCKALADNEKSRWKRRLKFSPTKSHPPSPAITLPFSYSL
jgi:hypothetical protein